METANYLTQLALGGAQTVCAILAIPAMILVTLSFGWLAELLVRKGWIR